MENKIRVFLADDHAVVRKGLEALIEAQPDMAVVGTAVDGEDALHQIPQIQPDVILLDIQMPKKSGLDVLQHLNKEMPQTRVLILTSFGQDETVINAIQLGALGYLLKDSSPQTLINAIRQVHAGHSSIQPDVAFRLIQELKKEQTLKNSDKEHLTEREIDVLKLVAKGLTNHQIAERLVVTERTVRTHVTNILNKLQLENRTQATLYALRNGLAQLNDE